MALRELVKRYPMSAFHQTTQRLAVGTTTGVIVIYDLRTATKWRILQGHERPVTALAFAAGGDLLASFCNEDQTLRWWQAGSSSLLGYFGLHGHCHKVVKVALPMAHVGAPAAQDEAPREGGADVRGTPRQVVSRLEWTSPSTVMLLGVNGKPLGFHTL